jgi:putative transposase
MSTYPSDLTDLQWEAIRDRIPPSRPVGVARQVSLREVVNAIRYRRRSGCAWRLLPHDFPHWRTVYGYDRQWRGDGTWPQIEQSVRDLRTQVSANMMSARPDANTPPLVDALTSLL